ncbi:MAG: glycosyltransferase [Acidobacteria bacterium]|nr:glycosyltransferase [Acidobacteriota bacterium]
MNGPEHIKVLFWPGWWYPDRSNPFKGIFIRRHAEAVAPLVDLAVLYVTANAGFAGHTYEIEATSDPIGLTVRVYFRPLPVPLRSLRILNVWRYFRAASLGIRELRTRWGMPDVIHLHVSPPGGQILALRRHFSRIPFLFTEHWTGYHRANGEYCGFFRKRMTSWVVRNAAFISPVSHDLQKVMEGHGLRGRFTVIPNAVRTDLFRPAATPGLGKPFTFLHVSRLAPVKNVSGILRAAAELWRSRQDFRLLIAGQGEERQMLEQLAGTLFPGRECVHFAGQKGEGDLAGIMRSADCFVLFSDYENLPCVIAEAMASGLPVIATRVGGVPEQVRPGLGILIRPRDERGLRQAMEVMIEGTHRYESGTIRSFAEREYSHAEVGKRYFRLYQDALLGQGKPK